MTVNLFCRDSCVTNFLRVHTLYERPPTQVVILDEELHGHHDLPRGLQVYPEFCSAVALFAALREGRHAHGGLGERLLGRLHQDNLDHTAFVDVGVKGGLPCRVHGGLPLDESLSSLWKERERERAQVNFNWRVNFCLMGWAVLHI